MHSITSAADSHTSDMRQRMKVYSIQMGLRVVCIIAMVLVDNLVARILLLLGAALLPWFAVLLANKGADRSQRAGSAYTPPQRTAKIAPGGMGSASSCWLSRQRNKCP